MRILIVGAGGLVGSAVARRLAHRHHLVLGGRQPACGAPGPGPGSGPGSGPGTGRERVRIDYAKPDPHAWAAALAGVDAVVNAAGIFREQGSQRFDAIHVKGPVALFDAAAAAGVQRIVQISALGAGVVAKATFLATKAQADAHLLHLPVRGTVVQPSLVYAPDGQSTRWLALLAALPLTPLPGAGRQRIQPVHLDDLCEAVERLLEDPDPPARLAAVGPEPVTLRGYLRLFQRELGVGSAFLPVPMPVARLGARLLAPLSRAPLDADALQMLEAGNTADPAPFTRILGRPPRPPSRFIATARRRDMRTQALLGWTVPLLRWSTAALWIGTGLVSAFAYPARASLALLARTGLQGLPATLALYGAAALDLALGLALFLPSRARRWAYRLQIALMLGYTAVISVFLPEYWAHPYGPVLKNLPLLAAALLLLALDAAPPRAARAQAPGQRRP